MRISGWWRRLWRPLVYTVLSGFVLAGTLGVTGGAVTLTGAHHRTPRLDGVGPCTTGGPPFPFAGFCGTFGGFNTFFGSYGPGFPTTGGFGFCADPPADGGGYPAPGYNYVSGGAPAGAGGDLNALGFALSEGDVNGYFNGLPGQFTRDQAAAAAKLLYDSVVWRSPIGALDPGIQAALDAFEQWFNQAQGMADAPIQLSVGLLGGGSNFTGSAMDDIHLQFPGTGRPLVGQTLVLSATGATFNTLGGPTTIGAATDQNGNVVVPIFASGTGSVSVTISTEVGVGQPGLQFFQPTAAPAGTQTLVGFVTPAALNASQQLTGNSTSALGTVSVQKAGNDTAYVGLAGAVFQVSENGAVVAALTTGPTGASLPSPKIPTGPATVTEVKAPPGYRLAPSQTVTIQDGNNVVVSYTGAQQEQVIPATVTLAKRDAQTGAPLAGAVFDVKYDSKNDGVFDEDLGHCATAAGGRCSPGGNDGAALLPGKYEVTEVAAPPGYLLNPATSVQKITLAPGEAGTVTFADLLLGSLNLDKTGNDPAYFSVAGAVFTVTGPVPSAAVVGTLTVGRNGQSNTLTGLVPGRYTITETTPPPGFRAIAPKVVTVGAGHTTTTVDVVDLIQPSNVTLLKVDADTQAPLAGAVFDVRYDSKNDGVFDEDLGHCTTTATGQCSPTGNDGGALLPGNYQVAEIAAPPGYLLDPAASVQEVTLAPGETGTVTFDDHLLVPASFEKVATGNVDPAQVVYAGAVIDVHQGSPTGPLVASCTTDATGHCTTAAVLVSGSEYCWIEVQAPPGLQGGASGCFVAANGQGSLPITVSDTGLFVPIQVKKVDAANPASGLPGAVFDLYRIDGGNGPDHPAPPPGAKAFPGQTWVSRATTDSIGVAGFPLQFPGYAYCVLEVSAPANFGVDPAERCTGVLAGSAAIPAPAVTLTVPDHRATVVLQAHKFNSLVPNTGIPGAVYDLYVEGPAPAGTTSRPPSGVLPLAGDTWYARGTTDQAGVLDFTVPSGYAWCLREVSAPVGYQLDPAVHCSAVLTTQTPLSQTTVALPEVPATVHLSATKYNSLEPDTVIPGASYALFVQGPVPAGFTPPPAPAGVAAPAGTTYWAQGTTTVAGNLTFAIPAGSSWCLQELSAPAAYQRDTATHCTAVLTTDTPPAAMTVALPELPDQPPPSQLAFTGFDSLWVVWGGLLLIGGGSGLWFLGRRRRPTA